MSCFRKKHQGKANSLITEVMLLDKLEIEEGKSKPRYYFTDNAIWDTGSEVTIVNQEIINQLGLTPKRMGGISGIGGNQTGGIYNVHMVLPNRDLIKNVEVYCGELPDYDVIIGMDIISKMDIVITNKENTIFSYRYPSEGGIDLA